MNDAETLREVKRIVEECVNKQGPERCWYHPDLFMRLIEVLQIKGVKESCLPPREEFEQGCKKYQEEQYKTSGRKIYIQQEHTT